MPDELRAMEDRLAKMSDHELLVHIAMRADHTVMLLDTIAGILRQAAWDSKIPNPTLGSIASDMRLLRRKLAGPRMTDPEEK